MNASRTLINKYQDTNLRIPVNLSDEGKHAWVAAVNLFEQLEETDYPSQVFYSPAEWSTKGESYGSNGHLIILHEEGTHDIFFSDEFGESDDYQAELNKSKLYCERCTHWYSSIYSI